MTKKPIDQSVVQRRQQFSFYERYEAERHKKKKQTRNMVVQAVMLLVLLVGGASAFYLSSTEQDIRQEASEIPERQVLPSENINLKIKLDPKKAQNSYHVGDKIYLKVMLDSRFLPQKTKLVITYSQTILPEISLALPIGQKAGITHVLNEQPGLIELKVSGEKGQDQELGSNVQLLTIEGQLAESGHLKFEFDADRTQLLNELNQDVLLETKSFSVFVHDLEI